ncbi:MAG: SMP-30/gluconolactonase/LRE family protein [Rhodospirillaceae bacterium]|nr:SMP-30/gluconolactonase/LRE family protein [Rhodospirillaceae bacterium]
MSPDTDPVSEVRVALDIGARLGEGPVWCPRGKALYFVDSMAPELLRWHPETGAVGRWALPDLIGSLALREGGGAVVALRHGLFTFDFESGATELAVDLSAENRENRFNDGKCDRRGRFWAGTMHFDGLPRGPKGFLYRFDADFGHVRRESGIRTSNGIGWSPNDRTMYYTDTRAERIYAYDFDPATGENSSRRDFAVVDPATGRPDGLTVDSEGGVWSANWGGWRVVRYRPDGTLDRIVEMPVERPTSVMIGGPDLRILYVTSAWDGLDDAARAAQPLAGHVFALDLDIPGLPEPRFAG